MISKSIERKIQIQVITDELAGLTSYITGKRATNISIEEYRDRYESIMNLYDLDFLELYNNAEYKVFINKIIRIVSSLIGTNLLISVLANGEFNSLLISIPLSANITRLIEERLPKSKLEKLMQKTRQELITAGGPDLGGMRRVIRAGLKETGNS